MLATLAVSLLAAWEFLELSKTGGAEPSRLAVLGAIVLLQLGSYQWPDLTAVFFGLLSVALTIYCTFASPTARMLADVATAVFGLFYIGLTLAVVPMLQDQSNGPSLVMFLLCTVWAGDIVAYYVGRNYGRHKLAPRLSPNKTWEGAIGSLVGGILGTLGLRGLATLGQRSGSALLSYPEDYWYYLFLAVLINAAAQVGDLAESALKRSVGVKDSGTLLPGHGGMLDRVDALLLAAPVLWYAQMLSQRFF